MACRITNIKDENLKLLVAQYGQADGLKRFLKGELNTEASILKVSDNLDTYKEYNLLNKNNELKNVNPEDQKIKDWVKTLNNSPYYLFKLKRTTDGKAKIFMYDKLATMGYSLDSEGLSPSKPTVVIARLENIKTNLYNLKNKTKERSKVLDINRRIKFLEDQIEKLNDESSEENIKETFDYQYKWISNLLNNPNLTLDELDIADRMLSVWSDIKTFYVDLTDINNEDLSIVKVLNDIERKSKDIGYKLDNVRKREVNETYKENSNNPDKLNKDNLLKLTTIIPDIDLVTSRAYDAATVNNPLANFVGKTIQTAYRNTKEEYNNKLRDLKEVYDNLSESDKRDFSWLYTDYSTKAGKEGRDFVSIISGDYYTNKSLLTSKISELSNKIEASSNPDKKKQFQKEKNKAIEELNEWKKENELTLDIRYLGLVEYENISKEDVKKYKDSIYQELGTELGDIVIERANSKYNDYILDKEAYEIDQENLYRENISEAETEEKKSFYLNLKEENLKNWDLEHNPIYRLQYLEGTKTSAQIEGVSNKGFTYLVVAPKNNNISSEYKNIMNNPSRAAFYKYTRSLIKEMSDNIPEYYKKDFTGENFIPVVRKDTLEKFSKFNFSGFLSKEYEEFIADITTNDRDLNYVVRDKDGNPVKQIPVNYLNSKLPLEDRSTDIYKIAQMYTLMSLNYKTASELEGFVNATIEITKKAKIDPEIAKSPKNLTDLLEYTRDSILYKEKQSVEKVDLSLFGNKADSKRSKQIDLEIKDLDDKILKSVNQDEIDKLKKQKTELIKEQNKLSGGKVDIGKLANTLIDIQSKKAFVLNPFSPLANLFFGIVSNLSYSAGGKFVDDKSMSSAFGIMLNSTQKFFSFGANNKTATKIAGIMDYFQVETNTENLYGVDNGSKKGFWSRMLDKGFFMMKSSDYFMRGQLTVAYGLNNSITLEDGTTRPVWEAFDSTGNIKEEFNTPSIITQLQNHRETLTAIQKEVHGNFDPLSQPMIKKYAFGRLLAQFRLSWVATGIQSRFQPERFDENLGKVKGRYRSIGTKEGIIKGVFNTIVKDQFKYLFNKGLYDNLSEIDQVNMKRNLRELYLLEMLVAIGMLLKHGLDDEDKKSGLYKVSMNLINRTKDDITFYLLPSSFNSIIKNPIPALSVIDDTGKALDSSFKYLTDEDYTTKNFMLSLSRPLPVTSSINKIVNWSEKEF